MDQDLSELEARVEQLLAVVRRLSEHNQSLRAELEQASTRNAQLKSRMGEARHRVQAVLDRLPRSDEAQLPLGLSPEPQPTHPDIDSDLDPGLGPDHNQAAH